ncbi:hypothetical protein KCP69_25520 [Salmonella enterica subsp. enterica]|nr:hypothetical protein KCP69_25520 [Salmonella enterica subsp. enterica]
MAAGMARCILNHCASSGKPVTSPDAGDITCGSQFCVPPLSLPRFRALTTLPARPDAHYIAMAAAHYWCRAPLINSVADMFKGHSIPGWRWAMSPAQPVDASACVGVSTMSMTI